MWNIGCIKPSIWIFHLYLVFSCIKMSLIYIHFLADDQKRTPNNFVFYLLRFFLMYHNFISPSVSQFSPHSFKKPSWIPQEGNCNLNSHIIYWSHCYHLCLFPCFEYPNRLDISFLTLGFQAGLRSAISPLPCLSKMAPISHPLGFPGGCQVPPCLPISNCPKHLLSSVSRLHKVPFSWLQKGRHATAFSNTIFVQT